MACLLNCLLRNCFDTDDDSRHGSPNRMIRLFQPTDPAQAAAMYSAAEGTDPTSSTEESTDGNDDGDHCCRTADGSTEVTEGAARARACTKADEDNPHVVGLRQFWKKFRERFNALEISADSSREAASIPTSKEETTKQERTPMLTQALSFDSSKEMPTILSNSIIYPGSDLQREMAKAMSAKLEQYDDECVICMDGFTEDNPRMPTLCGCGENKTYFHLPCLYQWIDQSKNCPSCAKRLRWEEF